MERTPWYDLTRIPLKAQLYARETYFREGLADVRDVLGDDAGRLLRRAALLVMKPDGFATGKTAAVRRFLDDQGFRIAAVERTTFGRFVWRELWRYQLTSATLDRLAVNDLAMCGDALVLLLRDDRDDDIPATVRLSGLKGPSEIAAQRGDSLRRVLAQPNRVLSFVHVADEPADVARELAIFLQPAARRRVIATLVGGTLSLEERDALAAAELPTQAFDAAAALRRANAAARAAGDAGAVVRAQLRRIGNGEQIEWRPFARALEDAGIELDRWDAAVLGAATIVCDEPGATKQITAVDPRLWREADQPS